VTANTSSASPAPFNAKASVTEGLDHLATRLDRIIAAKLSTHLGGLPWTHPRGQQFPGPTRRRRLSTVMVMFASLLGRFSWVPVRRESAR